MKMNQLCVFAFFILCFSCNKSSFLDVKPDQKISVPKTLVDCRALLDNDIFMNGSIGQQRGIDPVFLLTGTDDYFVPDGNLPAQLEHRNLYVWNDDIYGLKFNDWDKVYQTIFYTNVVLDALPKIDRKINNQNDYDDIKGSALFFRSRYLYQLAQIFAPQYNQTTAATDWGIVLRLISDVNEPIKRSAVLETYERIVTDLKEAASLLPPVSASPHRTRPSKPAAYAMLAKTFLIMQDYGNAKLYADSCLSIQGSLMNFNSISPVPTITSTAPPITRTNPETIFHSMININFSNLVASSTSRIDSALFRSYDTNDLRRVFYFRNPSGVNVFFKGSYDGSTWYFSGIAVDEVYLIRAEALVRIGQVSDGINDLNTLLQNRWKNNGSFIPVVPIDATDALNRILAERRKELVMRGTRWSDLRRLNLEGANITIRRNMLGTVYELLPNDKRYTHLIPPSVLSFNNGMPQNPR